MVEVMLDVFASVSPLLKLIVPVFASIAPETLHALPHDHVLVPVPLLLRRVPPIDIVGKLPLPSQAVPKSPCMSISAPLLFVMPPPLRYETGWPRVIVPLLVIASASARRQQPLLLVRDEPDGIESVPVKLPPGHCI